MNRDMIKSRVKMGVTVLLSLLIMMLLISSFFLGYLQFYAFEIPKPIASTQSVYTQIPMAQITFQGEQILLEIDETTIQSVFLNQIKGMKWQNVVKLDRARFITLSHRAEFNFTYLGFYIPVSYEVTPAIVGDQIILKMTNPLFGNKGVPALAPFKAILLDGIVQMPNEISIPVANFVKASYLTLAQVNWGVGGVEATLEVDIQSFKTDLQAIADSASTEILDQMKMSSSPSDLLAAKLIEGSIGLDANTLKLLGEDLKVKSAYVASLLAAADTTVGKTLYDKYKGLMPNITWEDIVFKQNLLVADKNSAYCQLLLSQTLSTYLKEDSLLINQGRPYRNSTKTEIAPASVVEALKLTIPIETAKRMSYVYDYTNKKLGVSYALSETKVIVAFESGYTVIDQVSYEKTYIIKTTGGEVHKVTDLETWNNVVDLATKKLSTTKLFVRFMSTDDQYAFAVVSPAEDYQTYQGVTFEKVNGEWTLLENNILKATSANVNQHGFNISLIPTSLESMKALRISADTLSLVEGEMKTQKLMKDGDFIEFCSFDGQFIGIRLNTGVDYVYKVKKQYLDVILPKAQAIAKWPEIPEIIMLQDIPVS